MKGFECERERVCPRCGKAYREPPALSRKDNETPICPDCGVREALETIGVTGFEAEQIVEVIRIHTRCRKG